MLGLLNVVERIASCQETVVHSYWAKFLRALLYTVLLFQVVNYVFRKQLVNGSRIDKGRKDLSLT